jgi:23S rRNA (pseudouridine1915-N3)-methyltransferase
VRIRIAAIGRVKEKHWSAACDEYLKRLRPYATFEVVEIADRDISGDTARAVAAEGADLLRAIPEGSYVIALDPGGTERSSEQLSAHLAELMLRGRSDITFAIGGSARTR